MQIPHIIISESVRALHSVQLGCVLAELSVGVASHALDRSFSQVIEQTQAKWQGKPVTDLLPIKATRSAYKAYGKDPSRYRPSAEALLRRVLKGEELYRINNAVDLLNLVSVQTGFSIGGYDLSSIQGGVTLRIGEANQPYEAIGRGLLNIEGLPVLFDAEGPFGCPTSDSMRTSVTTDTKRFLMVFFDFCPESNLLASALELGSSYLKAYGNVGVLPLLTQTVY